jgi:hypothetical protein
VLRTPEVDGIPGVTVYILSFEDGSAGYISFSPVTNALLSIRVLYYNGCAGLSSRKNGDFY